jgi:hypothetical protein
LSLSSFEKKGLLAIILKIKGLAARALGFIGFMIYFSIENPVDREMARSTVDHCRVGVARSLERMLPGGSSHEGSPRRHQEREGAPAVLTTASKGGGTARSGRATTMNTDGGMSFDERVFGAQREPVGYQDGRSEERTRHRTL